MLRRTLERLVDFRPGELAPALWSAVYFFCVLAAYYVLRPIRDEMGVEGGVENLAWLFSGTLAVMLFANPAFAALVSRFPRRRFLPATYRFFALALIVFYALLLAFRGQAGVWVGRVFFVWVSVFNLFVVSVFWAFMADVFRPAQGKRLFGFIAVGGTVGAVVGSGLTASLVAVVGRVNLLLVSVVFLEVAVRAMRQVARRVEPGAGAGPVAEGGVGSVGPAPATVPGAEGGREPERPIGGDLWAGITHVVRSPYLLGIVGYMLLYTVTATFLYFQQATIAESTFADRAVRTAFFAHVDLAVNVLTMLTQLFLTGRILKLLGVALTLTLLPLACVVGFGTLGLAPLLGVVVVFQVVRRAGNFAVARPTRELLYTVVPREDKYKAKSFIDTFVYRVGDQVGAWSYTVLGWAGLGVSGVAVVAVPLALAWVLLGGWLGGRQQAMARSARS